MVDLVIKNGHVVSREGMLYGGVAIDGEKIVSVGSNQSLPRAHRVLNAQDNLVIPGLIDPHVHMGSEEDPSLEDGIRMNWPMETSGALHGGVTTLGHMMGARGKSLIPHLEKTIKFGEQYSHIDFFCHAFVFDEVHLAEQGEMCRRGVTSFKHMFNAYKPRKDDERMDWLSGSVDAGLLFRSFESIAQRGYPCLGMVHCEEIDICDVLEERLRKAGRNDLAAWTESRPNFVEYMRIASAFEIARATGCPLYIVHISTAEGTEFLSQKRRQGYNIWGETEPHYLTHTADMEEKIGCWGKVNPAFKYDYDRERLWRGICDGAITNIGTDHGTGGRTAVMKEAGKGKHNNIWDSRVGIRGGLEHVLPVMMTTGVNSGRISVEDLVRVCCTNNAKAFGLYPEKGIIAPGSDADIVLVDPDKEATINQSFYHGLCEVSIYEGWKVRGMARTTLVRGEVMMQDYQTVGRPGHGRYVPRHAYQSSTKKGQGTI